MARTRGAKNKATGRRFKSYEGRFPDDRHLRLTKDMLTDPAFIKLSPNAKVLYIYLKLWASGAETVTFSVSMAKGFMTGPTFLKTRDELVSSGFIEYVNQPSAKYKGESGVYEFSSKWQGNLVPLPLLPK